MARRLICFHPPAGDPLDELKRIQDTGRTGVKSNIFWNTSNPKPGRYEFGPTDMLAEGCERLGLSLALALGYGNNYLYGYRGYDNPDGVTDDKLWAPPGYKPFLQFTRLCGVRWGGFVKVWQFGGEVNSDAFFRKPDPAHYVKLLKAATPHLPGKIIVGALANVKGTDKFDYAYLLELQRLGAFASKRRILGYNPYTQGAVETRREDVKNLRAMGIPFVWSEFGNSTGWPVKFTAQQVIERNAQGLAIADEFGFDVYEYCWNNPQAVSLAEKGFALRTAEAVRAG